MIRRAPPRRTWVGDAFFIVESGWSRGGVGRGGGDNGLRIAGRWVSRLLGTVLIALGIRLWLAEAPDLS